MVAPPGRVSTTTCWPQFSVIFCPMTRARMSVEPPGANGTMILIGFSGYLSAADCAAALSEMNTHAARTALPNSALIARFTSLSLMARRRPALLFPVRSAGFALEAVGSVPRPARFSSGLAAAILLLFDRDLGVPDDAGPVRRALADLGGDQLGRAHDRLEKVR